MSAGITFRDASANYVKVEYSTQVPPVSATTWTEVTEAKSIGRNPEASPEIDFTHYSSTEQELRLGLARRGSWDFGCNFVPNSTSQDAIITLDTNKGVRWWRITYPKSNLSSTTASSELWAGFVSTTSVAPPSATEDSPADFNFTVRSTGSYAFSKET
jgi:Lambda phage tail tube protein, TTP